MTSLESITDKIQYCVDTIIKETPQEERLVKQILFAMLSAYSNRPINLAINAPSGEGKNYILNKVAEKFPENDVMFLGGMTDKALFHRNGKLVIKNEQTGEYELLDNMLSSIDEQIRDKNAEILISNNKDLRRALEHQIDELGNEKKDLIKNAKKLVDLSHKILLFLDTPSLSLFAGIMPLLSHDKYEVEYEYTDTNNGIKTRTNVLRGFPAVIFAQAIDSSYHERFPEIKRRFIFVNPKMDKVKYDAAINLMCDKYGLPDFAYQAKVVSREQKNNAKSIIKDIAEGMIEQSERTEPDKNNTIVPFIEVVNKSLERDRTFDMTTAKRLLTYLGVLPLINYESRPRLVYTDPENPMFIEIIYLATFEDLKEAMYLMEHGGGARPYIMEWYDEVYLPTYGKLTEPNYRVKDGKTITERMIGLNTKQLSDATYEIQGKALTENQIRDTYLKPLFNENFINSYTSECDRRGYISFPLINTKKYKITRPDATSCNSHNSKKLYVIDSTRYPSKRYLKLWFRAILELPEITRLETKIISHKNKELDIDELVEEYYQNPEDYFNGRDLSYNLILVYKGSEFLNRLQRSYVVVSTLPVYYSEGKYPIRTEIELESEDLVKTFPPKYIQGLQISNKV
jgi:hypothetical protein